MSQFTVVFTNGATVLVNAYDKYDAIEKAKKIYTTCKGIREVQDQNHRPC